MFPGSSDSYRADGLEWLPAQVTTDNIDYFNKVIELTAKN